jgi:DNA-binding response OmpR family regulator
MPRILLVDDDVKLTDMIREFLEIEGFVVDAAHDGEIGLAKDLNAIDLVVLDVMLPRLSGFEVLKRLRALSAVPVIMLTARSEDIDRIVGLEIGADDYVAKPVNPRELVARIRAVLRRSAARKQALVGSLAVGEVSLNPSAREAWHADRKLDLTTAEFNLLEHLLRNARRAFGGRLRPSIQRWRRPQCRHAGEQAAPQARHRRRSGAAH